MLCDLSAYNGACDGNTLQINGETFGALVIPYVKQISARLADVLTEMDGLPVFFVDAMPDQVIGQGEKEIRLPKSCVQVQLINLCETLKAHGMYEVKQLPAYKNLSVYHYEKTVTFLCCSTSRQNKAFPETYACRSVKMWYIMMQ